MPDLTRLLNAAQIGDPRAAAELLPLVYEELRQLAAARMANEAADHTLQPTALVHEAWLRLAGNDANTPFANRAHFFAAAAESMRRILIERARRKSAEKRGAGRERVDLDKVELASDADDDTLCDYISANFLLDNATLPFLRIESISDGKVSLRVHGHIGTTVILDASNDLTNWQPISTNTAVSGGFQVEDPSGLPSRFYRARELVNP